MVFSRSKGEHAPNAGSSSPHVEHEHSPSPHVDQEYAPLALAHDMTQPLANYFISSSHNTYLHGHQLIGSGGTEVIATALQRGCRVIELDVYNEDTSGRLAHKGPVVKHGEALTSAVTFAHCIAAIQKHAFETSPYPVIITIENHCDEENQTKMAEVLERLLGDLIYVPDADFVDHQSPEALRGKVLVRAKLGKAGG